VAETSPNPSEGGGLRQWEQYGRWIIEAVVFDVSDKRDSFIITANGIPLLWRG
jgi:hypothetical protein